MIFSTGILKDTLTFHYSNGITGLAKEYELLNEMLSKLTGYVTSLFKQSEKSSTDILNKAELTLSPWFGCIEYFPS
jgi:hypothetical protein